MTAQTIIPPKPRSEGIRSEITRLPVLTRKRLLVRRRIVRVSKILTRLFTRTHVTGLENLMKVRPALIVFNHLGDADTIVGLAVSPVMIDAFAKAELFNFPVLGKIMDAYGLIWIHRGQPDRRALRVAMDGLSEGRLIGIAPEGRESLIGALEKGTDGAAYLALKGNVPIVPVTFTGTENWRVFRNMLHLRRTKVTLTIGEPFRLVPHEDRRKALKEGTARIMLTLARQLPPEYRGVYQSLVKEVYEGDA